MRRRPALCSARSLALLPLATGAVSAVDPKVRSVVTGDYHASAIPTQYVTDGAGIIRASQVGYDGTTGDDNMERAVRAAMKQTPAAH